MRSPLAQLWHEVEPILRHAVAAGTVVILAATIRRLITFTLSPKSASDLLIIDHYVGLVVFTLFGANTVAVLITRITRNIHNEFSPLRKARKVNRDTKRGGQLE